MFQVENADFIADKLAAELLPDQEYREVAKNAEEAVLRRMKADGTTNGRIEFDVDWVALRSGRYIISCADNGDGMDFDQLQRYTTTLAVVGANENQSIFGNQGMGLKISGPTRHKQGVLIKSLKDGHAYAVQIGWDGHEYGFIALNDDGDLILPLVPADLPQFIQDQGSGTIVSFLGNEPGDTTFRPSGKPRGWLFRYLHTRFYRFADENIELFVRVPSGDEEDWPKTLEEANERQAGRGGKSFNLSKVKGTGAIWDDAADRQGDDYRGTIDLSGSAAHGVPAARMHWWVLPPDGSGTDVSSRTNKGGSMSILYQNELHDWRTGAQANPYFARLGLIFGKSRVGFVLEPLGDSIASDFARAHVLVRRPDDATGHVETEPILESVAWLVWADQFRTKMPDRIKETMNEEASRVQEEDPNRAKRIDDRLKDVMKLLRPRRFRKNPAGSTNANGPEAPGPGNDRDGEVAARRNGRAKRPSTGGATSMGGVFTQLAHDDADAASEVYALLKLHPIWVTEKEAEGYALVNSNGKGLNDRAAALAGEDGMTAAHLLLNKEFRGYAVIVKNLNDWANADGDDQKAQIIESAVQEWVEQKMVEAVNALRQLQNSSTWLAEHFDIALSPVALTAAFMADRYHTLNAAKRDITQKIGKQAISSK